MVVVMVYVACDDVYGSCDDVWCVMVATHVVVLGMVNTHSLPSSSSSSSSSSRPPLSAGTASAAAAASSRPMMAGVNTGTHGTRRATKMLGSALRDPLGTDLAHVLAESVGGLAHIPEEKQTRRKRKTKKRIKSKGSSGRSTSSGHSSGGSGGKSSRDRDRDIVIRICVDTEGGNRTLVD